MNRLKREELSSIILHLDQAIRVHEEWFEALNRQMVCRLPYDKLNTREDAHRLCEFGQWLYRNATPHLLKQPAFKAIKKEHHLMHQAAAAMLLSLDELGSAEPRAYDRFIQSMQRLRLEINTAKHEIESIYYTMDSLTGANSRINMLTQLREQSVLSDRGVQHLSIAMLDLDHFKQINDTYGHLTGDQVLSTVSHHILGNIRPYDRLYRYGGEEFLLSMPHTDATEAILIIERLRKNIQQLVVNIDNEATVQVTVSCGVFVFTSGVSVEDAIQRADQALYSAKSLGRNCSQIWKPAMAETTAPDK